jgi:hypothetical protein
MATHKPIIIKNVDLQNVDLQQWQTGTGTVLARVDSAGGFQAVSIDGGSA